MSPAPRATASGRQPDPTPAPSARLATLVRERMESAHRAYIRTAADRREAGRLAALEPDYRPTEFAPAWGDVA